jgi:PPOX class probable F420-dependent enzyme
MGSRRSLGSNQPSATAALQPFVRQWTTLLTTYRRDGTGVGTPVNLAVEGDHAYFRTYDKTWKTKRIANNAQVEIVPSTYRGRPVGLPTQGTARLLHGAEELNARMVIGRKYPIFHGLLIPLAHRLARYKTVHYEVSLLNTAEADPPTEAG